MSRGRTRRWTPKSAADWGAVLPQYLGIVGLLAQLVLWGVTAAVGVNHGSGISSPLMLTTFGGLIVVGQGAGVIAALRSPQDATLGVRPDPDGDPDGDPDVKG